MPEPKKKKGYKVVLAATATGITFASVALLIPIAHAALFPIVLKTAAAGISGAVAGGSLSFIL